jgi:hypothetical protein
MRRRLIPVAVVVGLVLAAASTAQGAAVTRTQTYTPFAASDGFVLRPSLQISESVGGECEQASFFSATGYRCFGGPAHNGSTIFDPCFAQGDPSGPDEVFALICPTSVVSRRVFEVQTDASLRPIENAVRRTPWSVTIGGGRVCRMLGGATGVYRGQRINYACSGKGRRFLVGVPSKATKRWTITMITSPDSKRSRRVGVIDA